MTSVSVAARPRVGSRIVDAVAKWGFVAVTVLLIAFFAVTQPAFATPENLSGMLKYIAPIGIAGLGVTLAMTVGGLDLSVGANAGFAVSIAAWTLVIANQVGGKAEAKQRLSRHDPRRRGRGIAMHDQGAADRVT